MKIFFYAYRVTIFLMYFFSVTLIADEVPIIGENPLQELTTALTSGDVQTFEKYVGAVANSLDNKDLKLTEVPAIGATVKDMGPLKPALDPIKISAIKAQPKGIDSLELSGKATIYGSSAKIKIVLDASKRGGYVVFAPDQFHFGDLNDACKALDAMIEFKNVELILATDKFSYKGTPVQSYKEGMSFLSTIVFKGFIENFLNTKLTLNLKGFISKKTALNGSVLMAEVPTAVNLGAGITTQNNIFFIKLKEAGIALGFATGLKVSVPNQEAPLLLKGEVEFDTAPTGKVLVMGLMEGEWQQPFGFKFLTIKDVGLQAGKSYVDNKPISEFAMQGGVIVGNKKASLVVQIKVPLEGEKSISVIGSFEGGLMLSDIADLASKAVGEKIDISNLPELGIHDAKIYIVTEKSVSIFGKSYSRGVYIAGNATLFGKTARMVFMIDPKKGLIAEGYMEQFDLGVLRVTGEGPDRAANTPDDGAYVEIKATLSEQSFFISGDAELKAPMLGGIFRQAVRMEVTRSSVSFFMMQRIFDAFEARIDFLAKGSIDRLSDNDIVMNLSFEQSALSRTRDMFNTAAKGFQAAIDAAKKAKEHLIATKREVAETARYKMQQAQMAVDEAVNKLREAQIKLGDLDALRDRAETAARECISLGGTF